MIKNVFGFNIIGSWFRLKIKALKKHVLQTRVAHAMHGGAYL